MAKALVDLIRQNRPLNHRLARRKHHRQSHVDQRGNCKAEEPSESVRSNANTSVDLRIDAMDEAGHIRGDPDYKGGDGAPVAAVSVAVDASQVSLKPLE